MRAPKTCPRCQWKFYEMLADGIPVLYPRNLKACGTNCEMEKP